MMKLKLVPLERKNSSSNIPQNGVVIKIESNYDKSSDVEVVVTTVQTESLLIIKENEPLATILDSQCKSDNAENLRIDEFTVLDANLEPISVTFIDKTSVSNSIKKSELVEDLVLVKDNGEVVSIIEESKRENSGEIKINKPSFSSDFPPLWGLTSICGRRLEMEDFVVSLPSFLNIPSQLLSDSPIVSSIYEDFVGHVFGVYDGHGGSQVAHYCREHLHPALADEIKIAKENLNMEIDECDWKDRWVKIFLKCFHRMDNEVGGFPRDNGNDTLDPPLPPVAPDFVGSTAVVAVICSTHIIVANCGDSRAVLCRGKISMPLSIDHKPNREDECARIEAAGGKVINWDGYRVSGVLAMSRSIGDRYLRPYVISDPEVMFIPRAKEDECLILASDGLWDIVTNEEACILARKRILLWHKNNGTTIPKERGSDIDPAAQDAAEYLSKLASHKGSRDNISVIVIDLKSQRKFRRKSFTV